MAWSGSKIFLAYLTDCLNNTSANDGNADTFKVALFDNSITPSQTVATASTIYGAGVWASGGVFDASGWPAVGRDLVAVTSDFSSNIYTFDANDTVSANNATILSSTYGALVYDDTTSDHGMCFSYFGGAQSVSVGTFTIVWNSAGILQLTL